jgi:hypothetical protein
MPRPTAVPAARREPTLALLCFLVTPLLLALGVQRLGAAPGASATTPTPATDVR